MTEKRTQKLSEKLANLSSKPGVYLFRDKKNEIIYIGKAKVLRNRVRSYFHKGRKSDPKLDRLVSRIANFETIITDSDVEALILEANLVRENKPRYNINLKDDKSFPYIRVTNEPFPRIFVTRKIVRDGSRYFGPFTDVRSMKALLKTAKKIFAIRSCNLVLTEGDIARKKFNICLDYHIQRCHGPCEGFVTKDEYQKMIDNVVRFIDGHPGQVVAEIKNRMQESVKALRFEEAARLRDQLEQIELFQNHQKVMDTSLIDRDIIATAKDIKDSCCVVFKMREGKLIGRQHFYLNSLVDDEYASITSAFLRQYYLDTDYIPDEIFLSANINDDLEPIRTWLSRKSKKDVDISCPSEGEHARLVKMCKKNATLLLEELKIQKYKSEEFITKSVQALQSDLSLTKAPIRIEGFDISNIQGTEPVASMVCFINGQARKSEYRKFKIKSKSTPDDFAMMHEAVGRRYSRLLEENQSLPDLVLIDGGKGQLNAALDALNKLGIPDLPVIALAKRLDEVFIPGVSSAQNIRRGSPGLHLLQRVRDESHRFAVTFHRSLRTKRNLKSELDDIDGIGPARRKMLMQKMGSMDKIKSASIEDLSAIEGIPPKLAEQIWNYFNTDQTNKSHD